MFAPGSKDYPDHNCSTTLLLIMLLLTGAFKRCLCLWFEYVCRKIDLACTCCAFLCDCKPAILQNSAALLSHWSTEMMGLACQRAIWVGREREHHLDPPSYVM